MLPVCEIQHMQHTDVSLVPLPILQVLAVDELGVQMLSAGLHVQQGQNIHADVQAASRYKHSMELMRRMTAQSKAAVQER